MKLTGFVLFATLLAGLAPSGFAFGMTNTMTKPMFIDADSSAAANLGNADASDSNDNEADTNDEATGTDDQSSFGSQATQGDDSNDPNMMDDDSSDDSSDDNDDSTGDDN